MEAASCASEKRAKEQAAMEAARQARLDSLKRGGRFRPSGSILVDRNNCDEIRATLDIDRFFGINRPMEKEEFLAIEKHIWNEAMDFWRSKDMSCECDLIPDNMTLYPVLFEKHTWYHCNLLGRMRDLVCPSHILIFVEVKCKREPLKGRSYNVMSCIALDKKSTYNCKVCPTSMDIMHPQKGDFTCGSEEGQELFFYTIPRTSCSSDAPHNETATLPFVKSNVSTSCSIVSSLDCCNWLKGERGTENDAPEHSHCDIQNVFGQLIK